MHIESQRVDWALASPFRTASHELTEVRTVQTKLSDGGITGRGEALGVFYNGETVESMLTQLESVKDQVLQGISRTNLRNLLPPGGARNAVDCALWDLEAKRAGCRAWELAGLTSVKSLITAYTLSVDLPDSMAQAAATAEKYSLLKLKLDGTYDLERVRAVRRARPDADIIVDANQSWNERQLHEFTRCLAELGVMLIEQPLPAAEDDALAGFRSPIPFCADEACQTTESVPSLIGKYQYINIKLDKTGGLTEALRLAREAQAQKFQLMVGCMAGSSLSMAPAFIIGQLCTVVDLDGPLLSAADLPHAIRYEGSRMFAPAATLWG